VSEGPKKPDLHQGDPFEGLDWDRELEDWDKSASGPGGATVPDSFASEAPPTKRVDVDETAKRPAVQPKPPPPPPAASPSGAKPPPRPLYRPPSIAKTAQTGMMPMSGRPTLQREMVKPPSAAIPTPIAPLPRVTRTPPPADAPPVSLSSLIDDEDDQRTKVGTENDFEPASHPLIDDDEDDDGRTVVGAVSSDLLDQLGGEGPSERHSEPPTSHEPIPAPVQHAAPPVEIDLLGLEDSSEPTAEHPHPDHAPIEEDGVVTSAPDYQGRLRSGGRPVEQPARVPDQQVGEGEMFDPFKGLDTEPPVSDSLRPPPPKRALARTPSAPPPEGPGPKLLEPQARKHSPEEVTKVIDRSQLAPPRGRPAVPVVPKVSADATVETVDPFATADPFGPPPEAAEAAPTSAPAVDAAEESVDGGLIDLLRGDETSSDALPTAGTGELGDEQPAATFVGEHVELWRARCERIANDARGRDKNPKARGLVVASELAAIAGDRAHAIELAEEAWEVSPGDPLAIRQLRQLLAAEGRWDEVAPLLESEAKSGSSPELKAHAAILAADAARLARAAPDESGKLYETAQRASQTDVRPMISRALSAIAAGKAPPVLKWPQNAECEMLAEAIQRRAKGGEPAEDTELAILAEGIATFAESAVGVEGALAASLDRLSSSSSLGEGVRWVRTALDIAQARSRSTALDQLDRMPAGRAQVEAKLALALDVGDPHRALEAARALSTAFPDSSTQVVMQALQTPTTAAETSVEGLAAYASEPGIVAIARGIAIASSQDAPPPFASDDALDASVRVARRLTEGGFVPPELRERTSKGAQLGFRLGDALGGGGPRATIDALSPLMAWPPDATVDELVARAFVELAEGDADAAREAAKQAAGIDPASFAPVELLLGIGGDDAFGPALDTAQGSPEDTRGAALAVRVSLAALRRNDLETARRASEIAITRATEDPTVPFLAELRARRAGDFDAVVEAVRARVQANADPAARAANLVREVFLMMGTDLSACIDRAAEAAQLIPDDPTVRALYERIAGEGAQGRAEYRARIASQLEGRAKGETLLDAAREAERRNDLESAEKFAVEAEQAGIGAEATTLRHRVQSRGDGAARLAEELLEFAKQTNDPSAQREAYETLADLDLFARNDAASAILWHRAILDTTPGHLPSLRRLEHMLLAEGREDDYESVASELARTLPADARDAHAEVAARLRLKRAGTPWESIADLVDFCTERETPSLWATRLLDALARFRSDDKAQLRACDLMLARIERPTEVAALATRAAECAFRLGDTARAKTYLERALEADPQHPTALASLAELRRHEGDTRGAAETIEAMAQTQVVPEHRLEDWHAAAVIWLDKVQDVVRGRAALERAAEIDLGYADVFERLVALARDTRENEIVADLYARRLGQLEDVNARALLQVDYSRVLMNLGDRDGARAALAAALEVAPDNLHALQEGARLAEEADDWPDYESYLLRLAQAMPDPESQVDIHRKLGALYLGPLANLQGAEQSYKKILEHREDDDEVLQRLVRVYVELGDGESAVETHKERVRLATDPTTRRTRLIELAQLLDDVAGDSERALKALEQARAGDPADLTALAAIAEFHTKHGRPEQVAPALDAAIAELRTKIDADPGDADLLAHLVKILELRGRHDAVKVVQCVLAGVRGEPSELVGADDGAALPELDALLCPPEIDASIRALLVKAGEAIEKSVPVDLRALKAAKLGANNPPLKAKIDAVAHSFGLPDPDVVISRAMPLLCLPVGAKPFQIVIGEGVTTTDDDLARKFALARTMKLCGAHCAALVRVPPAELKVYLDALLHHLHPEFPAPAIEAERLDEITKRLQRFIPRKEEAELKALAAAVVANGSPDTEALASAAATWGDRVALLAVGDIGAALRGIAWTLGQKDIPHDLAGRRAWIADNPAARDLLSFALSDVYVEARNRAGVGNA